MILYSTFLGRKLYIKYTHVSEDQGFQNTLLCVHNNICFNIQGDPKVIVKISKITISKLLCSKIKHDTLNSLSFLIIRCVCLSQRWCNLMHAQYRQNYIIIRQSFFCFLSTFCRFCAYIITHNPLSGSAALTVQISWLVSIWGQHWR